MAMAKGKLKSRRQFISTTAGSIAGLAIGVRPSIGITAENGNIQPGGWAAGGTSAMTDIASYPDPFTNLRVTEVVSMPTCSMTLGPCHDDQAPAREDISEGKIGLPMRLGFNIVDSQYRPVTDANVDIWHCDIAGHYSSETVDNLTFCTDDDPEAIAARFFRGDRMTDQNGTVWFNSCMPGWYPGRAIHIHVTIRRSNRQGEEYLTTQFAFPVGLIEELFSSHEEYSVFGQPQTEYEEDFVFEMDSLDDYTVNVEQMSDGTLMAWKTIMIRSSLSDGVCRIGLDRPAGSQGRGGPLIRE